MYILLVRSAIDETGHPLFAMDDIPKLRKKSLAVLDRLQRRCLQLNAASGGEATTRQDWDEAARTRT